MKTDQVKELRDAVDFKSAEKSGLLPIKLTPEQIYAIRDSAHSRAVFYFLTSSELNRDELLSVIEDLKEDDLENILESLIRAELIVESRLGYFRAIVRNCKIMYHGTTAFDGALELREDKAANDTTYKKSGDEDFWKESKYLSLEGVFSVEQIQEIKVKINELRDLVYESIANNPEKDITKLRFKKFKQYFLIFPLVACLGFSGFMETSLAADKKNGGGGVGVGEFGLTINPLENMTAPSIQLPGLNGTPFNFKYWQGELNLQQQQKLMQEIQNNIGLNVLSVKPTDGMNAEVKMILAEPKNDTTAEVCEKDSKAACAETTAWWSEWVIQSNGINERVLKKDEVYRQLPLFIHGGNGSGFGELR